MANLSIKTQVTLFEKMKQRDENSWNEFFRIYSDMARHWARTFRCAPSQIDDVVQETMIRLMQILPALDFERNPGSLRALLKKIVMGKVCDVSRRQGAFIQHENSFFESYETGNQAGEAEADLAFLSALLRSALERTSRKVADSTYKAFSMYVLDAIPADEVCRRLGNNMKPATLYQLKSRFLQMLEKEFTLLLLEHNQGNASEFTGKKFMKLLDAFLGGQRDYRNTMVMDFGASGKECISPLPRREDVCVPAEEGPCIGVFAPSLPVRFYSLNKRLLLGSNTGCDIRLDNPGISGLHMEFKLEGNACRVTDLASANGVMINQHKLDVSSLEMDGAVLRLPDETLVMIFMSAASALS